jgi:hypothetical protein
VTGLDPGMSSASSQNRRGASDDDFGHHHEAGRAAGRSTLTSRMPARGGSRPAPVVEHGQQSRPAAHHAGDDPFGLHLVSKGSDSGGEGEGEALAPPGAKNAVPHVEFVSKAPSFAASAEFGIRVHGQPNSTVVLYLTDYFRGKLHVDHHLEVHLGPTGVSERTIKYGIYEQLGHHALHVRASSAPGVFSNLMVTEYDSVDGGV